MLKASCHNKKRALQKALFFSGCGAATFVLLLVLPLLVRLNFKFCCGCYFVH
jgi:hypothetical protein